jgi:hypothetical protein
MHDDASHPHGTKPPLTGDAARDAVEGWLQQPEARAYARSVGRRYRVEGDELISEVVVSLRSRRAPLAVNDVTGFARSRLAYAARNHGRRNRRHLQAVELDPATTPSTGQPADHLVDDTLVLNEVLAELQARYAAATGRHARELAAAIAAVLLCLDPSGGRPDTGGSDRRLTPVDQHWIDAAAAAVPGLRAVAGGPASAAVRQARARLVRPAKALLVDAWQHTCSHEAA